MNENTHRIYKLIRDYINGNTEILTERYLTFPLLSLSKVTISNIKSSEYLPELTVSIQKVLFYPKDTLHIFYLMV